MTEHRHAALIIGASGGIGGALQKLWAAEQRYQRLLTTSRRPQPEAESVLLLDLQDEQSIAQLAQDLQQRLEPGELRTVAICTGLLHGEQNTPERRLAQLDADAYLRCMQVNALGPLLLAKHLTPLMPKKQPSSLLAISARVGSIADNRLGGWHSYRCSKAALNQGFQTLSIELRRSHPGCVVTLFHPGTVDTALSQPFQRNVPEGKLFAASRAAEQLSQVMHARTDPKAHLFVDWAGHDIEY